MLLKNGKTCGEIRKLKWIKLRTLKRKFDRIFEEILAKS